jgi:hypothetical protein
MSVVRIKKRENPYVQIDKRCLEDKRLSWRSKGILAYLLSKPDGWNVSVKDIWNNGKEGRNAVQDCLAELQEFGYAELVTKQAENGVFAGSEWVITEEPKMGFSDESDKPEIGKPTNRKSGFRLHSNNTVDTNNENTNNKSTSAKPPKAEKKESPAIHQMVEVFEKEHQIHFKDAAGQWIGFTWRPKEFGALRELKAEFIKRLKVRGADFSDVAVVQSWAIFLQMAAKSDPWILKNQFTPTKLWGDFQGIIQKIQGNGKQQPNSKPSKAERQKQAMADLIRDVQQNGLTGRPTASDMFRD